MKSTFYLLLLTCVVAVNSRHRFLGTNVGRALIYHYDVGYHRIPFTKRVENLGFAIPMLPQNYGKVIQGILAIDLTNSDATANVTSGGLGFSYMNLRMKSGRGRALHYDVYVFV